MICPSCQHQSPPEANFCEECGASLAAACGQCGAELSATAKFCANCGAPRASETAHPSDDPRVYTPKHLADKILQSKSALEGERKQVTVLFADVEGSTSLAEALDAEEWHAISDRFIQVLFDGVHRFEGTVNQVTGDGVMALFGAPIAHEDHAQRACYAALHLRDALKRCSDEVRRSHGVTLAFRMGINSGEVVVGKIGDDLRMDYTAAGLTTNLADRVQKLCDPGSVNLSEDTSRLVEGYFQLRDLGEFELPGISTRVGIQELEGVGDLRTRLDLARQRGFSRFVGRDGETATLETALERSRGGDGQVVGVVADAGTGKSRLCEEFVQRCRASGVVVLDAHCPSHGKTVPLLPMFDLLRGYFGIEVGDADRLAREKIAGRLLLLDREFEAVLPLLFDFLGVPDPDRPPPELGAEVRQRQLHGFVRRLVQAQSAREPSVILIDDLHWVDPASDAFVAEMVDGVEGTQALLLVNFRPAEYTAQWAHRSHYQQLLLEPLGAPAIRELVDSLVGKDASLEGLADRIYASTGGNPFFTEEVVQGLIEAGQLEGSHGAFRLVSALEEIRVPGTVQAVLQARIDRLPEREKHLLQTASVIGKEFAEPLLARTAELPETDLRGALAALVDAEFLLERSLYPQAEYGFKHPLTQLVAYETQLQERRRRTHAAVARALEAEHPDRLDEQAALIAQHYELADDLLAAARWNARAAEWVANSDNAGALAYWRRVLDLADGAPASEAASSLCVDAAVKVLSTGGLEGISIAEVEEILERGRAHASSSLEATAKLNLSYGIALTFRGQYPAALRAVQEGVAIAKELADPSLWLEGRLLESWISIWLGRLEEAVAINRAIAPEVRDKVTQLMPAQPMDFSVRYHLVWALSERGLLSEAEAMARELGTEAEGEHIDVTTLPREFAHCLTLWPRGMNTELYRRASVLLNKVEERGSKNSRTAAWFWLGIVQQGQGEWSDSEESLGKALELARSSVEGLEPFILPLLARSVLWGGDPSAALGAAREAVERTRSRGAKRHEAAAHLVHAEALLETGAAVEHVEDALKLAADLIEETDARVLEPQLCELRAASARTAGRDEAWRQQLGEAHRLYTAMGAASHADRVAAELEQS